MAGRKGKGFRTPTSRSILNEIFKNAPTFVRTGVGLAPKRRRRKSKPRYRVKAG